MSGFNFAQPASTGASGGSLFGTTSNAGSGGSTLFGNSTSTASPFGTNQAGKTAPSLFGNTNTSSAGTTNLFGQPASNTSNTFSFAKKADDNKSAEQPKPSIFNQSTSQTPATPGGSTPSFLGSTTPATTSSFSFANPSTTPAGLPQQPSAFGASTGGGNIFGNAQTQNKTDAPKQAGFSLGTTTFASNTQAQNPPSLFGTTSSGTGNVFGAKPADQTSSVAKIGSPATETTKSPSFVLTPPSEPSTSNSGTLFGTASTGNPPATTTSQSAKPLFGSAQPSSTQTSNAGGMFSKPASTTASAPSLFGGQTQSSSEKKPPFSFPTATSQPSIASQTAANTSSTPRPLFGAQPSTTATTSASSPAFKLPSSTTVPPTTSATATTSSTTPGLFSLGGASNATPSSTTTTAAAAAKPGLFSLGSTTAGTNNTTTSTAAAPSTTAAPVLGQSTLGASTSGPTPPAQSRLRNKTLDEILTRWATDLTRYTKDFKSQGETIAQWDQIIVDNSSKIDKLYIKTRTCEKQTMSVEMQLAAVENQQNELESWLTKYENDVEEMLAKDGSGQSEVGGPDQERERTYKLAEKLNERLEDMGRDLESMVEQVNAANASLSKHTKADEPITQIVRILNSHLTQLQQIDQGTAALQAKVSSAQKAADHLGYLNGGAGAEGRAAVEDFYRSYMGRR